MITAARLTISKLISRLWLWFLTIGIQRLSGMAAAKFAEFLGVCRGQEVEDGLPPLTDAEKHTAAEAYLKTHAPQIPEDLRKRVVQGAVLLIRFLDFFQPPAAA